MRIQALHIDGFGRFADLDIPDLSPGLTVFLGPNEAGKSTLLAFVRSVLFGFPDGRSKENPYPPLLGGRHGGHLILVDRAGIPYTVQRHAGKRGGEVQVTSPGLPAGGEQSLRQILGSAERGLFRNVFAFSLEELQRLENLEDEDVRSVLYSAGLGSAVVDLPQIEKNLLEQAEALFKPRGSKPRLNETLKHLKKTRDALRELGQQPDRYTHLRQEIESLAERAGNLQDEIERGTRRQQGLLRLQEAWESWVLWIETLNRLEKLPQGPTFPSEGVARLEALLERRRDLRSRLETRRSRRAELQVRLEALQPDERLLEHAQAVRRLGGRRSEWDRLRMERPGQKRQEEEILRQVQALLAEIDPSWGLENLRTCETSLPARERVRAHAREVSRSTQRCDRAEQNLCEARRDLQEAKEDLQSRRRALGQAADQDPGSLPAGVGRPEDAERRREALARAREALNAQEKDSQRLDEIARQQATFAPAAVMPLWIVGLPFLLGLAFLAWQRQVLEVAMAGLVFGFLLSVSLLSWRRTSADEAARRQEKWHEHCSLQREKAEQGLQETRVVLAEAARTLDLSEPVSRADLDHRDRALLHEAGARESLRSAQDRLNRARGRAQNAEEEFQAARTALEQARKAWSEERPDLPMGTPETALEVLERAFTAQEHLKRWELQRATREESEKALCRLHSEVCQLMVRSGRPQPPPEELSGALDRLLQELEETEGKARERAECLKQLEGDPEPPEVLEQHLDTVQSEIRGLLEMAGAEDEEAFRLAAAVAARRKVLLGDLERLKLALRTAGAGRSFEEFTAELRGADPDALAMESATLEERLREHRKSQEQVLQEKGRVQQELATLENSAERARLHLVQNSLQETLRTQAWEWATRTLAVRLLQQARARYEQERQPEVIRTAAEHFAAMTSGRYPRLFAPVGEKRVLVERADGTRLETSQLSRGTAEQLYLALRLGFVQEFSRRSEPLPLVMDDIFVNFDPERANSALNEVLRLTDGHQVLIFTCHPETVQRTQKIHPPANVRVLEGSSVRAGTRT